MNSSTFLQLIFLYALELLLLFWSSFLLLAVPQLWLFHIQPLSSTAITNHYKEYMVLAWEYSVQLGLSTFSGCWTCVELLSSPKSFFSGFWWPPRHLKYYIITLIVYGYHHIIWFKIHDRIIVTIILMQNISTITIKTW